MFQPRDIANLIPYFAIQEQKEIHGTCSLIPAAFNEGTKQRSGRVNQQIWMEVPCNVGCVLEWIFLGRGIEQKIEGVEGR